MKKIRIEASSAYDVYVGYPLADVGEIVYASGTRGKVMIISDDAVYRLYGETVADSLKKSGYEVYAHVFRHGEISKTLATAAAICDDLAANEFTRSDIVAALGGGVVGDVAGFAAAIYLRGIGYIQLPTTLLAAVDSSVGGKTAVDLAGGKNLAGAFHQPKAVICDVEVIKKLPDAIFACGMGEVIKYGVIRDAALFDDVCGKFDVEKAIVRSVEIKGEIVKKDEFDNGERRLLNFGHTFGHAYEKLSGYALSHGAAVAVGMVTAARFAEKVGVAVKGTADKIAEAAAKFGLPCEATFAKREVFGLIALDKKRRGDTIGVVLPEKIGKAIIKSYPIDKFYEVYCNL